MTILKTGKKKRKGQRERALLTFYISMMVLPMLQFAIFYIYINFNSLKMSFWEYSIKPDGDGYMYVFSGFGNFIKAIKILMEKSYLIVNSLKYFAVYLFVGVPLALIFSFYIYKGYRGSKFYKVILFLPNIISSLIFALLFKYIVTNVYVEVISKITSESVNGLLDSNNTKMATLTFYNIWVSFGVNMLMFSSAMGNIPKEVVEAGELDGMNIVQEFFLVTLPMIYSTITSIIVICMTGIFSNQMALHAFYGTQAESFGTLGYYLFMHSEQLITSTDAYPSFSTLSAMGVLMTLVMVPITLMLRKVLNKVGPSEE